MSTDRDPAGRGAGERGYEARASGSEPGAGARPDPATGAPPDARPGARSGAHPVEPHTAAAARSGAPAGASGPAPRADHRAPADGGLGGPAHPLGRRRRPRPAPGASTTAHELAVRHRLLLALSALLTLSLFMSYEGVHGDADPLRTSSAPAVLSIDTALYALGEAERDAGAATPTSDFQKQISVAAQSLAAAAGDNVGGPPGRQALQTVAALITVYAVKVQQAQLQPAGSALRQAYLSYATSILTDKGSGILARLKILQAQQRAAVHRQTSFGPLLWLGWAATLVIALTLAGCLLETQLFLRRRFRRRYNRGLLAAGTLLAAGLAVTLLFTVWTHQGMTDTRRLLDRRLTGPAITDAGRETAAHLAHTGFRASAAGGIPIGGILVMALAETGLRRHIDEYRFRPR
ncbi:hypothetical protein [Streptomyces sp. NEAU-sy36]|uniref:hypothetical protein n=2 Tax=unclassified Streptomyces TaxID=2593676 RepID=UPI0027D8C9F6|nr:hypothetical protein [Streptomyces sp. NEAU-sy36]